MAKDLVKIPKAEYEELLDIKASFEEIGSYFTQSSRKAPQKIIDWDNLPTEDIKLYKPSFIRKLKRSLKQIEQGRVVRVNSLSDV